jgi:HEAT repeat protein
MVAGVLTHFIPVLTLALTAQAGTAPLDPERTLTSAGLKTDSESLLAFFRQRTLSPTDVANLDAAVRRLGDDSFEVRTQASAELVAAGAVAVRFLQPAVKDPDLEIARRAERCLEMIQRGSRRTLPAAAALLLAARKPSGAVEALLGYVPFAEDEYTEETVLGALVDIGLRDPQAGAALHKAVADAEPARRAAAACVLGQAADPAQRRLVLRLLTDPAVKVRLLAARTLLAQGEKAAMPVLIALLTEAKADIAWEVEELLCRLAGETGPEVFLDNAADDSRRLCRAAWERWWAAHEAQFDATRVQGTTRFQGLTVIADLDKGRVLEVSADHKERWQVSGFGGPVDVQVLANGHVLVAENHANRVTERDATGKIVWQKANTSLPASCQRLSNGHTFIALHKEILEVGTKGEEIFKQARPEGLFSARKLHNRHMVLLTARGKVITLDAAGKEIGSFDAGPIMTWSSLDVLSNGHCLVCGTSGRVVELDPSGKRVWECTVANAVCASRLSNGHTLVCDSDGHRVVEVDHEGKSVWEHRIEGRPWFVRRR